MTMAGQIIIVNGTSGSGKSTTCKLFAKRSEDFWLLHGIDHFLGSSFPRKFGHHGELCEEGISAKAINQDNPQGPLRWFLGEWGKKGFQTFHEWIAAASRSGCNIIVDHLMMTDPPVLQDCIWRLQGLPVLLVTLKPPYEALLERIAQREIGNRFSNSNYSSAQVQQSKQRLERLRPWFYEAVYANSCCDLEIDTTQHEPDAVCERIERCLQQSEGTAFAELRLRYPQTKSI